MAATGNIFPLHSDPVVILALALALALEVIARTGTILNL
jgi:hypothetical protein